MATPATSRPAPPNPLWGYLLTVALVGVATAIGHFTRPHLALPDLVMLYLLVVMVAAARFGRGPSLVAATLSSSLPCSGCGVFDENHTLASVRF